MNEGLEGLADSVSQVMSTSFDTPFSSTPMTTEWKAGLLRSYRHKLHGLPFDQYDEVCEKIDDMAKNLKPTGDAVTFVMFLINLRIRCIEEGNEERLAQEILETVPEDDSISLPSLPSTSIKSPPIFTERQTKKPVIVEGIPLLKSQPFMVKTVISEDESSEVTILHKELKAQGKEQAKINQAILDQFENLRKGSSTKIANKGQEMFTKIVLNQAAEDFDPIPKIATNTSMGEWMDSNWAILAASPWNIDGRSMINMETMVLADASKEYRARSTKLGMIM